VACCATGGDDKTDNRHREDTAMNDKTKQPEAIDAATLRHVAGGAGGVGVGTDRNELIIGTGGNDTVYGGGGHDVVFTGAGDDQVQTGDGDDGIDAGSGQDSVWSGGGHDIVFARGGHDQVQGGAGDDSIDGGSGQDSLWGQEGDDYLYGGRSGDELQGGEGDDVLDGGIGDGAADRAWGGAGDDAYIWAPGDGNDMFQGNEGNDALYLEDVTPEQLLAGLTLPGGLTLSIDDEGVGTVLGADGKPASFNGTFTIGGETLTFTGIESIRLV
jgi:Ca2+-binding RTX toxin-like protein